MLIILVALDHIPVFHISARIDGTPCDNAGSVWVGEGGLEGFGRVYHIDYGILAQTHLLRSHYPHVIAPQVPA